MSQSYDVGNSKVSALTVFTNKTGEMGYDDESPYILFSIRGNGARADG